MIGPLQPLTVDFFQLHTKPIAIRHLDGEHPVAMETVGERIRWVIRRAGTNQAGLAAALGVAPATVTTWVKGRHKPHADSIQAMADLLGVDRGRMLVFIEDGGEPPPLEGPSEATRGAKVRAPAAPSPPSPSISTDLLFAFASWCDAQRIDPSLGFATALSELMRVENAHLHAALDRARRAPEIPGAAASGPQRVAGSARRHAGT